MLKTIVIIVVVVGILIGGLMTLRRSGRTGMPSQDVLDRATQRAREQEAAEKSEKKD